MAKRTNCEVILLRHAHSTANLAGILAGRDNSVSLSPRGFKESVDLAPFLSSHRFDAIYSSPLTRCQETIAPWVQASGVSVDLVDDLIEMEYGSWSGETLAKLSKKKKWEIIQSRPSTFRFPDGESFLEMSARANQAVLDLAEGKERILVVSHGDVIKAILAFHLGMNLDTFQRISVDPASISIIHVPSSRVVKVNSTSHLTHEKSELAGRRDKFSLGGGQGVL